MPCFCKNSSKAVQLGGALVILAGAVLASNNVSAGQEGNSPQAQPQQKFTLDTLLTRDMTFATPGDANKDAAWEKIQSQLGKPAPSLSVGDWHVPKGDFKGGDIKSMRGDIIVIDFWGTWCGPCKAYMPHTSEMAEKYADKQVRVVGVCNTFKSDTMVETAEKHDGRFPMAADVDDKTKDAYGVQWWPYYVVIDRDGIVRAAGVRNDKVETVVDRLLELQPPKDKKADKKEEGETAPRRRNR